MPTPPASIGRDLFSQFRSPRRGSGNPERMTNPVWLWAVEQRLDGWALNIAFDGPPSEQAGPCWAFGRFGMTETTLPDGRLVRIGGEYEDWYDADFYIYNDVIVTDGAGQTEIFGYSEDVFPPTDFHTATLVEDRIIVIGGLSHRKLRKDKVQLLALDTGDYRFERLDATGEAPPWLYEHSAENMEDGTIVVRGGLMIDQRLPMSVENIDDWRLDLGTLRWDRLTRRAWPRFSFVRADRKSNHLYDLRRLRWERRFEDRRDKYIALNVELTGKLGLPPRLDLYETLFLPDMPHVQVPPDKDEFRVYRLTVEGVTVRYVESSFDVTLTVEGTLPADIVERLRLDLLGKFAGIENAEIDCVPLLLD